MQNLHILHNNIASSSTRFMCRCHFHLTLTPSHSICIFILFRFVMADGERIASWATQRTVEKYSLYGLAFVWMSYFFFVYGIFCINTFCNKQFFVVHSFLFHFLWLPFHSLPFVFVFHSQFSAFRCLYDSFAALFSWFFWFPMRAFC